jgi:hypothetical protein
MSDGYTAFMNEFRLLLQDEMRFLLRANPGARDAEALAQLMLQKIEAQLRVEKQLQLMVQKIEGVVGDPEVLDHVVTQAFVENCKTAAQRVLDEDTGG